MKLRRNVLQPLRIVLDDDAVPAPLDADPITLACKNFCESISDRQETHFATRPRTLLELYARLRSDSTLGHLFRVANRWHATVDTVVILCRGDSGLGAQAFVQSCSQPFWNHLSRAERGSKPRVFFIDDQSDTDSIQGLLHMLCSHRPIVSDSLLDAWALLVLEDEVPTRQPMWQLEPLLAALQRSTANDAGQMMQRVVWVARDSSQLATCLQGSGTIDWFPLCDEPAVLQCFGAIGLLPAALVGINVMELLAGASWMTDQFLQPSTDSNRVLRYLLWRADTSQRGAAVERTRIWNPGLSAWQRWHDALNRGVSSAADRGNPAARETSIVVERPKFDPIELDSSSSASDRLLQCIERHHRYRQAEGAGVAEVRISELDELHTGQLMQWNLLTSALIKMVGSRPEPARPEMADHATRPEADG